MSREQPPEQPKTCRSPFPPGADLHSKAPAGKVHNVFLPRVTAVSAVPTVKTNKGMLFSRANFHIQGRGDKIL